MLTHKTKKALMEFTDISSEFEGADINSPTWEFLISPTSMRSVKLDAYKERIAEKIDHGFEPTLKMYKVLLAELNDILVIDRNNDRIRFNPESFASDLSDKDNGVCSQVHNHLHRAIQECKDHQSVYIIDVAIDELWWGLYFTIQ